VVFLPDKSLAVEASPAGYWPGDRGQGLGPPRIPAAWPGFGELLQIRYRQVLDDKAGTIDDPADALPPRPAAAVAWRMSSRWREENYFRYGRAHFALDALDSYKVTPDNPARLVPNPAKNAAKAAVTSAAKAVERAEARRDARLAELKNPAPGTTVVITNKTVNRIEAPVQTARRKLQAARDAAAAAPAKIPLVQHNPKMVRLDTQTKLITHAVRMAAFNTEVMLARALHGHYARAGDEAAALIREALTTSGDIIPASGQLHVCLDPLSAPRRTRSLAALCDQLNQTCTTYPGTDLILRYKVKNHPDAA
jgi:hypothetical protein